jgi:diguanylate cyclase (GGDEF)-like protein
VITGKSAARTSSMRGRGAVVASGGGTKSFCLSMAALACVAALLPDEPLLAVLLFVQWTFAGSGRSTVSALMLSLIAAYLLILVLSTGGTGLEWKEGAALLMAATLGVLSRSNHERALRALQTRISALEHLVAVDELTGVHTRRHVLDMGRREIGRSRRSGSPLSILLLDLDNLKLINDGYGHVAGDMALAAAAQAVHSGLRAQDAIGRWGGDEFLVLLPDTDAQGARETATRLQGRVAATDVNRNSLRIALRVSVGIATCPDCGDEWDALVEAADRALYGAKDCRYSGRRQARPGAVQSAAS